MSQIPASRLATSVAAVFLASLLLPLVAADNVNNDVTVGGTDTVLVGVWTTVKYFIIGPPSAADGQAGCNAADSSPATLTINAPAAVEKSASSLTFTACGPALGQTVQYRSLTAGDYPVTVSISDSGAGSYNNNAAFTLHVLAPPDTDLPSIEASVSPAAASSGWYNLATGAPTISFTCSDATSAIVFCGPGETLGQGAGQMVTGRAEDAAGNEFSIDVGPFDVDLTAPSITASLSHDAAESGWYNLASGAPTAHFECSDGLSGIASCSEDEELGDGEGQSATGTAYDNAGNSASASTAPVDIDLTPPSIAAVLSPDGWYNLATGAPTASFECSDGLSGLASCPAEVLLGEGEGQVIEGTAYDVAGNSASAESGPFDVDLTGPSIVASLSPDPAPSGWYNLATGAPTASFECSDGLSGIASCPGSALLGEGLDQSHEGTAYDVAGNDASATAGPADVDLTAPSIDASLSPDLPESGWYNLASGAPTVHFECSDALSGIASCSDDEQLGEGEDQSTEGLAEDVAGNSASASSDPIDVDLTAPSISASLSPAPAGSGWYNIATGVPTASFECSDELSGIASCPGSAELEEGSGQSLEGTASDVAGNSASATAGPADIDLTAPSISASLSPAPASNGWYNLATGAPTASFECSDALSGVASCEADVELGEGLAQSHEGFALDHAGNGASAIAGPADVDLTAPVLSLPADFTVLATGVGGGPASFSVSASDNLDSDPGVTCSADSGDLFAPGPTTVTCEATDEAGNVAAGSFKVTVRYDVSGFFQPVDPNDLNTVKAGSTVPLKFTIRTASGGPIGDLAAVGSFAAKAAVCAPLLPDPVDFVTTGGTSLRYDATAGQFIQNWKTPATKGCVRASVTLADGSVLSALFQLK